MHCKTQELKSEDHRDRMGTNYYSLIRDSSIRTQSINLAETLQSEENMLSNHEKRFQSRALMNLERNTKIRITLNNLKLIMVLNFLLLISIGYTLYNWRWYEIQRDDSDVYYINPLLIARVPVKQLNTQIFLMLSFQGKGCNFNPEVCLRIPKLSFSGIVAFLIIALAMILQMFNILQLILMVRSKMKSLVKCVFPIYIQLLILFLYFTALIYWFFASGIFPESKTNQKFIKNIGLPVLIYLVSMVFYVFLISYSKYVSKKGRKDAMVNKLLNAEQVLLFTDHQDNKQGNIMTDSII